MPETSLIRTIWLRSEGQYFCISTKSVTGAWRENFFARKDIGAAIKLAQDKSDTNNVYMCPHGFSGKKRVKELSIDPNWLYADLDECDPRKLSIKPTIAIESSPGRFVGYWYTDKPASEELNRRLCYHIGADNSGWDRTQVLRVPGTKNHKYRNKPVVKILWKDGPSYQISRLEKVIPQLETVKGKVEGSDATKIYDQYEKSIPQWLRRELNKPEVQHGKRSEVLWRMVNDLLEVGMSKQEIFTLLWDNPWNKHADRRDGEQQLELEINKAADAHVGGSKRLKEKSRSQDGPKEDPTKKRFKIITMDKVREEQVDWVIPQMIARKQTTIFEGDPGVGKSYFLMWLCIHFCDGKRLPWLDKAFGTPAPMRVVYCDMENSAGAVTKVRLQDNGLKNGQNYVQFTEPFSVDDEDSIEAFRRDVLEEFKPDIVVIDPVNLYIGSADTYRASETQQALQVLKSMSEEYNFALIIVRHLNKSSGGKALYAGNGSIAFAGVARIIATVGWHPEEPDLRVVACTKNNLSQFFGSLGYTIQPLPDTLGKKNRSELTYEGHVEYTSDDILSTSNKKDDSSKNIAMDLIRDMLEGEEVNYHTLLQAADSRSISELSIKKAAGELGLKRLTRGKGKERRTFLVVPDAAKQKRA